MIAIVKRDVNRALSSGEQKTFALRIFAHRIHVFVLRNTIRDLDPGCARVACAKDVRSQIVEAERVDRRVRFIAIEVRRFEHRYFRPRYERRRRHVLPFFPLSQSCIS